jgi:dTDP-4-amino-4,6-dideoxygalactose transaminase
VIRVERKDELKKYLDGGLLSTQTYYFLPLQPVFKGLDCKKGDFVESEKASKEVLSLPICPELKREYQNLIIKKIKEFYEQENSCKLVKFR